MTTTTVNGRPLVLPDDPDALLIDVIRDAGLTGTKLVCGSGVCGACTVLLDGAPVVSCLLPAQPAADKSLITIEGVGAAGLHPMQKAFMAHDALQCGFCTPGQIMSAVGLISEGHAGDDPERVREGMSGNLCRCSAYVGIVEAVLDAQDKLTGKTERAA